VVSEPRSSKPVERSVHAEVQGIVMGRRKINNSETKVEIEGSGDDHEPQGLALLVTKFGKFQQNMNRTESTLVRQLDEYQETNRRG
jgi:hypothetical protein